MYGRFLTILSVIVLLAGLTPVQASAKSMSKAGADGFDEASTVSDKDLATMRGGFFDVDGMLIDFSFLSRVQVGLNMQSNVIINAADFGSLTPDQLAAITQPVIVQNSNDNTQISVQQAINLQIVNPQQLNNLAQSHQLNFLQALNH